jgi:hypothetical protein
MVVFHFEAQNVDVLVLLSCLKPQNLERLTFEKHGNMRLFPILPWGI